MTNRFHTNPLPFPENQYGRNPFPSPRFESKFPMGLIPVSSVAMNVIQAISQANSPQTFNGPGWGSGVLAVPVPVEQSGKTIVSFQIHHTAPNSLINVAVLDDDRERLTAIINQTAASNGWDKVVINFESLQRSAFQAPHSGGFPYPDYFSAPGSKSNNFFFVKEVSLIKEVKTSEKSGYVIPFDGGTFTIHCDPTDRLKMNAFLEMLLNNGTINGWTDASDGMNVAK